MRIDALYDIEKTYMQNIAAGPRFDGSFPEPVETERTCWLDFLGYPLASPLGVPAGPLLNSQWIKAASDLGFDLLTYKTIRSKPYHGHPLPNVIFVAPDERKSHCARATHKPFDSTRISITNSFGMPSMSPDFLQEDIARARCLIPQGKILVVSIVGSSDSKTGPAEDFVRTALIAKDAGAQIIEANFSCPNICSKEGSLFQDPENASQIASKIARAVSPIPLMVKIGDLKERALLRQLLIGLAKANVQAICGINSVPFHILDNNERPALGPERETGGVCGDMIRPQALEFVRAAASLIQEERLDLTLAGCGGIMQAAHFDLFLQSGAKAALSATGMMWDPYLAIKWKNSKISEVR